MYFIYYQIIFCGLYHVAQDCKQEKVSVNFDINIKINTTLQALYPLIFCLCTTLLPEIADNIPVSFPPAKLNAKRNLNDSP